MRQTYELTDEDFEKLLEASKRARSAPVIAMSVADGIAGRDFSSMAYKSVDALWDEIGTKYGFVGSTVQPHSDGNPRKITAEVLAKGEDSDG